MIYLCISTYLGLSALCALVIWSACSVSARTNRAVSANQLMEHRYESD